MIESIGYLNYRDSTLVLETQSDLGKYLRNLFWMATYKTTKLGAPERGNHITLVSHYENSQDLSHMNGIPLFFYISLDPYTNGNAYWLPVSCPQAETIRDCLGLGQPDKPFHFGVGYLRMGKFYGDKNQYFDI